MYSRFRQKRVSRKKNDSQETFRRLAEAFSLKQQFQTCLMFFALLYINEAVTGGKLGQPEPPGRPGQQLCDLGTQYWGVQQQLLYQG